MDMLALKTPIGEVTLFAENDAIVALDWGLGLNAPYKTASKVLNAAAHALTRYFKSGVLEVSELALEPNGTPFQKRVWRELHKIPSGQLKTYGEIAKALRSSARAVGSACRANPIPLLIPCHRVVGAHGQLIGYSGGTGVDTKAFLLRLEGART